MFRPQTLAGLNSSLTLNPGTEASHGKYCQNGRPYLTDPATGQSLCLCQLDNHSAHSLQAHPALRGLRPIPPSSVNLADIHSYHQPQLTSLALGSAQNPGLMSTQLGYHPYMTMYAGVDVNGSPIRKAATRETTGPLKVWLSEHKKNPYPTKAEKIMLAIITRMTLTQVSTWFANARRRLKKDNRLSPGGDDTGELESDKESDLPLSTSGQGDRSLSSPHRVEAPLSSEGEADLDSFSDISDEENEVFPSKSRVSSQARLDEMCPVMTSPIPMDERGRHLQSSIQVKHPIPFKHKDNTASFKQVEHTSSFKQVDHASSFKQVEHTSSFKQVEHTSPFKQVDHTSSFKQVDQTSSKKLIDNMSSVQHGDNKPSFNHDDNNALFKHQGDTTSPFKRDDNTSLFKHGDKTPTPKHGDNTPPSKQSDKTPPSKQGDKTPPPKNGDTSPCRTSSDTIPPFKHSSSDQRSTVAPSKPRIWSISQILES